MAIGKVNIKLTSDSWKNCRPQTLQGKRGALFPLLYIKKKENKE